MYQFLRNGTVFTATLVVAYAVCAGQVAASTIVAPVSAFSTSNFVKPRSDYSIENTIDQSGLSLKYESGVTDFDEYLAGKPQHTSKADGNEWFSKDRSQASQSPAPDNASNKVRAGGATGKFSKINTLRKNQQVTDGGRGQRSATGVSKNSKVSKSKAVSASVASPITKSPLVTITYGFSELTLIDSFVLWNEEFAGIGLTELWSSIDGVEYSLLSTINPQPSKFAPDGKVVPYLMQVFSFDPTLMKFIQLLIFDCPKPSANKDSYRGCGIGEVAFTAVQGPNQGPVVPVPAALPLLASALGLFAWLGRRQRKLI
jgi:hypothetical protein